MKTVTIIGNGNMALSIAKGLAKNYDMEVVGRDLQKLDMFEKELGVEIKKSLLDGFDMQDKTIILCVKPANIEEVSKKIRGKARVIYSVLAGTTLLKIRECFTPHSAVRCMPNLAASVQKSITSLAGDKAYKNEAMEILGSVGQTCWLDSEKELDIATALAGSGPAYLALIAEALTDGAVKQGMKRADAMVIMQGLFDGFAEVIKHTHPALLKDAVMSPGGTTAAGYSALEDGGVRASCINAIEKAYKKAVEMS